VPGSHDQKACERVLLVQDPLGLARAVASPPPRGPQAAPPCSSACPGFHSADGPPRRPGPALTGFVQAHVAPGAIVVTNGWQGYAPLSGMGYRHRPRTQGARKRTDKVLPRVHRVLGNLQTWLRETHHGVGHQHLQAYLDEFTFRFNRRRTPIAAFQTLLGRGGQHTPTTYKMLYGAEQTG
jgi:transposase-like protein